MIEGDRRKQRELLLTTLIDLLIQILFVFLLAVVILAPKDGTGLIVEQAKQLIRETGKSLDEIKGMWRRLIDPDTLDNKQKQLLAEWENYERLKNIEQRLIDKQGALDEIAQKLKKRFRALGDPPCIFADSTKTQPVPTFTVQISDGGLRVSLRLPPSQEPLARELPVSSGSLNRTLSVSEFQREFRSLYEKSRAERCRHYVVLEDSSTSVVRSNAHRTVVEGYFYLLGGVTRRP